jgi:IclR family KDG regulon transcriptional repressor
LTHIGKSQPILSTSVGKVLISTKTEEELEENISMEVTFNKTDMLQYDLRELLHVQEKGYAISYNNFSSGLKLIAASVKNESGDIIAAIDLIAPEQRIQPSSVHTYVKIVTEAAAELVDSFNKKN